MRDDEERMSARRRRRVHSLFVVMLFLIPAACTSQQQTERIEDVEPERLVNTDLSYPKNPQRWPYVGSRVSTDPRDPFPGFRVVVANPLAARAREENRTIERGAKYAQLIFQMIQTSGGISPGALERVNVIVQDSERYASTGGYGYASFDGAARPIAIEPRADCIVCHTTGPLLR
jgi:hypothetical protein